MPTFQVTGIEDKNALQPPVKDFWYYAWETAKHDVHEPEAKWGLAINSKAGRTENQFHIHIACVRDSVLKALATAKIGKTWTDNAVTLEGDQYDGIEVASLESPTPLEVLQSNKGAKNHMDKQSLAVVKAPAGYYLLNSYSTGAVKAEAEKLLEEKSTSCISGPGQKRRRK